MRARSRRYGYFGDDNARPARRSADTPPEWQWIPDLAYCGSLLDELDGDPVGLVGRRIA